MYTLLLIILIILLLGSGGWGYYDGRSWGAPGVSLGTVLLLVLLVLLIR